MPDLHIKLKFPKKLLEVMQFNQLLRKIDCDWPYGINPPTMPPRPKIVCTHCGGYVYNNPRLTVAQVKALSKALDIKTKFIIWKSSETCRRKLSPNGTLTLSVIDIHKFVTSLALSLHKGASSTHDPIIRPPVVALPPAPQTTPIVYTEPSHYCILCQHSHPTGAQCINTHFQS